MKARQGFVSNSSSSSFVMFATAETFEAVLSQCNELQKMVAEKFISGPEDFLGRRVMNYSYESGNIGDYCCDLVSEVVEGFAEKYPEKDAVSRDDMMDFAFSEFETMIAAEAHARGESVLTYRVDC